MPVDNYRRFQKVLKEFKKRTISIEVLINELEQLFDKPGDKALRALFRPFLQFVPARHQQLFLDRVAAFGRLY
jgi:hypothetical protein